jgi:lipopolysaccharide transport system ATP-binding protein
MAHIKLDKISVYGVDTIARAATLKQWIVNRKRLAAIKIPILENVSFEARHGDRIAILGMNGSGKSSLLKVISGNYPIHGGTREVQGVVAPLIEMGAGFDPEVSGRANIKLSYAYRGKLRNYSKELEDKIVDFSEIGEKIALPLKTYSAGMMARLAFSSAIFQDPDILMLDEIFATGDGGFIEKSRRILTEKVHKVSIAIMVNHGVQEIMDLCNRAILIHQGRILADGPMHAVNEQYRREILHLEGA